MSRTVVVKGGPSGFRQVILVGPQQLLADEAEAAGSNDEGPDPYEFLLACARTMHEHDPAHVCKPQGGPATGCPYDVFAVQDLHYRLSAQLQARCHVRPA